LGHEWMASKHSETLEGIDIIALVFNGGFWKDAEEIIVVMECLVRVIGDFRSFNFSCFKFHFKLLFILNVSYLFKFEILNF